MRYPVLAVILVVAACGGKSEPTGPSDEGGSPAVLQIMTGDGQQAAPSAAVPNAISVKVTDGTGHAVSGVTVAFHVDSGGGSIAASSALTSSAGLASPGSWTLGSAEGRNILTATVGSLAPVRIVASAVRGLVTIPPQTIGTGGGTITVNTPGSPINGFTLEIPSGSFSTSQTVTISTAPSTSLALPEGATAAGPIITIRTSHGGYATHPMYLTIPNAVPAGMFPALMLIGANGPEELLPTFSYNGTSMKAWTRHLDRGKLASAGGASLRDGDDTSLEMVQVYVPVASLYGTRDTEFKVGVDNWEFHPVGTVASSSIAEGMITTEAWYYARVKKGTFNQAPSLNRKFRESDGVEFSNRRGIRWSAVEAAYSALTTDDGLKSVARAHGTENPAEMTTIAFQNIRVYLRLFQHLPAVVQLLSYSGGEVQYQTDALVIAVDRHAPVRELFLATSVDPLNELVIPEPAAGGSINVTLNGLPGSYTTLLAAGASQSIDNTTLQANYAKVQAGTIGDDIFPKYRLMSAWGGETGQAAPVDTALHFWLDHEAPKLVYAECTTCVGTTRPVQIPAGAAKVTGAAWWSTLGGSVWGAQNGGPLLTAKLEEPGTIRAAGELYAYGKDNQLAWLDYIAWNAKHAVAGILPLLPKASVNSDFTLSMDVVSPPALIEYFWDFGDGTTGVSTTRDIVHKWTTAGTKTVIATARYVATKEPVAREKADVEVQPPLAVFKFTSLTVVHEILNGLDPIVVGQSNSQGFFTRDSARFLRMRDGLAQGGIYLVEHELARSCTTCGVATFAEGLYLLEGATIDRTTLATPVVQQLINAAAGLTTPAAPTIYAFTAARAHDPTYSCRLATGQFFTRTGDASAGHVTGSIVRFCSNTEGPNVIATNRVTVDVTINGDNATGTIIVNFDVPSINSTTSVGTKRLTVTFAAKRVVE